MLFKNRAPTDQNILNNIKYVGIFVTKRKFLTNFMPKAINAAPDMKRRYRFISILKYNILRVLGVNSNVLEKQLIKPEADQ